MNNQGKNRNTGFVIQGIILASASIIVRIIGVIYRIPMTNILGDEGNALYSYAFEIYNIALLLSSYSLPLAVSKLVAARYNNGQQKNAYRVLQMALLVAFIVGALVGLIVFFGSDFIAGNIMKAPMSAYALRVLAPCLFIVALLGVIRGYFQGLGTTIPTATSQILEQIINAIVSVVAASYFLAMGKELVIAGENDLIDSAYGAAGGTLGTVLGAFAALLFMVFVLLAYKRIMNRQIRREVRVEEEPYGDILKILACTALPVIISASIYNINTVLDQGIYNHIMSGQGYSEETYYSLWGMFSGKYNVLKNVPVSVANAFATSVIPSLTIAVVHKNRLEIHKKIEMAIRLSMLIAIPSFVGFFVFAEPILNLLFVGDNKTASYIMMVGSISIIFYCLSTVTNGILQGLNKMKLPIKNACIALVIHLIFLLFFIVILKWNIFGVVLSMAIFSLIMCVLNGRDIKKYARYKMEWKKTFILPIISSLIMGVTSYGIYCMIKIIVGEKIGTVIAIGSAALIYTISLIKTGALTQEDIYGMPKGGKIVRILKKAYILK